MFRQVRAYKTAQGNCQVLVFLESYRKQQKRYLRLVQFVRRARDSAYLQGQRYKNLGGGFHELRYYPHGHRFVFILQEPDYLIVLYAVEKKRDNYHPDEVDTWHSRRRDYEARRWKGEDDVSEPI